MIRERKMCFNLPYTLKKGKLIIVRRWGEEGEKEDIGLLVKEVEKWNKINRESKVTMNEGHDCASPTSNNKYI